MAVPRLPMSAVLLDAQRVPWDRFDDVFWKIVGERKIQNGYFALPGDEEAAYLFLVDGAPYGAGRFAGDRFRFGELAEFFEFYRRHPDLQMSFFQTDKGLILGLLVMFQKAPAQQFTTDLVDIQEAMHKVAGKGVNAIISYRMPDRVGVSLFMKGRLQANYFCEEPRDIPKEGNPLDSLVVYVYSRKETAPVAVAIFEDPKATRASDAAHVRPGEQPRLTHLFAPSAAAEPAPVAPAAPAGPPGPKPELVLILGEKTLGRFPVVVDQLTIGRAPGNDILIDNLGVSRRHAVVKVHGGQYLLEDLGSANGTFVNGERITAPRELQDGDQITIVKHTVLFQTPRQAAAPAPPPQEMGGQETMYVGPEALGKLAATGAKGPAPKAGAAPKLVLTDLSEVPITKPTTTFGNGFEADIRVEGFLIGKIHARIDKDREGRCRFVRMGRLGSTKINNQRVETHFLRNGDVIEMGSTQFIFRLE